MIGVLPRELRTARLRLRAASLADAPAVFHGYARDAEVIRYLAFRRPDVIDETEDFLRGCVEGWRDGTRAIWAITPPEGGVLMGMIGLEAERHGRGVGYVLARDAWGRGYATEALRAVLAAAFAEPATSRVWAAVHVANGRSAHVLEKSGMRFEGRLRHFSVFPNLGDDALDVLCYARTRDDAAPG
jgi:RimJ/RimL family protein N-acetyltransferase